MGVHGLWQILEPAGRPVDIHSLRGKILAVDASIWLHQLVKGFRDKDGNPLPNAHLLGVFYRVCKLLSVGIKPVFVFDGGVPILKKQTLATRKQRKLEASDKAEEARQKLLSNFLKQQLQQNTKQALSSSPTSPTKKSTSPKKKFETKNEELDQELKNFREKFALQITPDVDRVDLKTIKDEENDSSSSEEDYRYGMDYSENFSAIVSKDFDTLPLETQHEILFEMQESRKMNSWGKMEQMPQKLQDFSSYQMERLVKRRFLQKKIQSVQQEMGQRHIHVQNLDELLKMDYNFEDDVVGSKEKGFVLLKKKSPTKNPGNSSTSTEVVSIDDDEESEFVHDLEKEDLPNYKKGNGSTPEDNHNREKSILDLEEEEQLELAIQLSLGNTVSADNSSEGPFLGESSKSKKTVVEPAQSQEEKELELAIKLSLLEKEESNKTSRTTHTIEDDPVETGAHKERETESSSPEIVGEHLNLRKLDTIPQKKVLISQDVDIDSSEEDSEDDDFEEVIQEDTVKEVPKAIASINLADVININETSGADDFFADVFTTNEKKSSPKVSSEDMEQSITPVCHESDADGNDDMQPSIMPVCRESAAAPVTSSADDDAGSTNWDSDPEMMEVEQLEKSASQISHENDEKVPPKLSQDIVELIEPTAGCSKDISTSSVKMITMEFMQAQEQLNTEQRNLMSSKGQQERVGQSISEQISIETQELLALFGIPYVISPFEAESQCAFFDHACLTDGTITDDSDIWLFGGLRVYKNFYSAGNKHIEFYQQADITKILNLDRDKLVLIAMLSGGDYSDGIEGVGPVTALELLTEFPTNEIIAFDTLVQIREWWDLAHSAEGISLEGLSKVKEKLRKLKLRPGFPSDAVYQAYMNPSIDSSTDSFRWGNPDFDSIREYSRNKFGWDQAKCDSMLLPVLKNFQCGFPQQRQLTLDTFLTRNLSKPYKKKKGSKRLHSAFEKLRQIAPPPAELNLSSDSNSDGEGETPTVSKNPEGNISTSPKNKTKTVEKKDARKPKDKYSKRKKRRHSSSEDQAASPSKPSTIDLHKKESPIPQKVQTETQNNINKQKAIKILTKKDTKKPKNK